MSMSIVYLGLQCLNAQVLLEESGRAGVESLHLSLVNTGFVELLSHGGGQHLSQLHTPLVERAQTPDESLHGSTMLVNGQQLTTRIRVELAEQQRRRRTVAREVLVLLEMLGHSLSSQILVVLSVGQSIGLGEEVTHQLIVVGDHLSLPRERILALAETNKIAGNNTTLVDELIETMLAVRARFTEVHLTSLERKRGSVHGNALTVRLHIDLLNVSRETEQSLGIGKQSTASITNNK